MLAPVVASPARSRTDANPLAAPEVGGGTTAASTRTPEFRELVGKARPERAEPPARARLAAPAPARRSADPKAGPGDRPTAQAKAGGIDKPAGSPDRPQNGEASTRSDAATPKKPATEGNAAITLQPDLGADGPALAPGVTADEASEATEPADGIATLETETEAAETSTEAGQAAGPATSPAIVSETATRPEALAPLGLFAGDSGGETEGFVEMLASAGGAAAPGAPTNAAGVAGQPVPAGQELNPAATAAAPAIVGAVGGTRAILTPTRSDAAAAPSPASGAANVATETANGQADAVDGALPGGPSSPAIDPAKHGSATESAPGAALRASVPQIQPGRIGAPANSVLVNPNADLSAELQGGMGIAAKLMAKHSPASTPEVAAGQPRPGLGELTAARTDAPSPFAGLIGDQGMTSAFQPRLLDPTHGLERPATAGPDLPAPSLRPTPVQMLPIEIGMQALRGATQFQIRLDPAELGRVEVRLEIKDDGEVNASLVVDRVETLALLKREAPTLQQAFEQAGLRQGSEGLSFSLRGEGQPQGRDERAHQPGQAAPADEDNRKLQREISELALRRVMIPHASVDRVI